MYEHGRTYTTFLSVNAVLRCEKFMILFTLGDQSTDTLIQTDTQATGNIIG